MEYRSYQVFLVVLYGILASIAVGLAYAAESAGQFPDYSVPIDFALFFLIAGLIGFYVRFRILRGQLDRHGGSIPMPGILGAFADIDDDDDADPMPELSGEDLVARISPDQGTPLRSVRCPQCGTEETRSGSTFCRGCGAKLPSA